MKGPAGFRERGSRTLSACDRAPPPPLRPPPGTSPLYAFQSSFSKQPDRGTVLSTASLFFWTLTLIVLVKYVGVVLRFDDNGEGARARACTWPAVARAAWPRAQQVLV